MSADQILRGCFHYASATLTGYMRAALGGSSKDRGWQDRCRKARILSVAEPADAMTRNAQRLALVRGVHTLIYGIMAVSTFVLVYAGLTGSQGWWLWVALALLGVETAVFAGNGMKCPLTALAVRYGAEQGYAFDTFLPERATRHTFRFFGSLMVLGLVILALRWLGVIGQ